MSYFTIIFAIFNYHLFFLPNYNTLTKEPSIDRQWVICLIFLLNLSVVLFGLIANKMHQDSNVCTEDYDYFSRPEILQDIRFNLAALINQDRCTLEQLIDSLNAHLPQDSTEDISSCQPICQYLDKLEQVVLTATRQMQERSFNLRSVGHLAIKMIDFITEESTKHADEVQHYQAQVDRLQDRIDEVTSRNTLIQNDVMIFREQLLAAREQLEEITEEREQQAIHEHEDWQATRDLKIQNLEKELEKMRSQLTYFKVSALSKSSINNLDHELPHKNMVQTSSLGFLHAREHKRCQLDRMEEQEDALLRHTCQNRELEEQNQKLKMEIDDLKKSTIRFNQNKDQSPCQLPVTIQQALSSNKPSRSLLRVKTSTKSIHPHQSPPHQFPFDFNQFLNLFKSKREERLHRMTEDASDCRQQEGFKKKHSQLDLQSEFTYHNLNTQWSRSSLAIPNPQPLQSELILLTQQSEEEPSPHEKDEEQYYFKGNSSTAIENKETEASLKDSYDPMKASISSKAYSSIGINTQQATYGQHRQQAIQRQNRSKGSSGENELFGSRIMKKIVDSSLVSTLTNYIVNKRIKRKCKVANSGTATILN